MNGYCSERFLHLSAESETNVSCRLCKGPPQGIKLWHVNLRPPQGLKLWHDCARHRALSCGMFICARHRALSCGMFTLMIYMFRIGAVSRHYVYCRNR